MKIRLGIGVENIHPFDAFDSDYQAILTAGSAFTQPSSLEQNLQNQLIVDLKSAGIWAKLDAFYMFCNGISTDSTGAFARINWKNPSANYGTSQGTGLPPISAKNGFTGNGNGGVNLNFNPTSAGLNFNSSNASLGVYVGVIPIGISPAVFGSTTVNQARVRNTGGSSQIGGSSIVSAFKDNQFIHINRTEIAGPTRTIQAFIDGISAGTSPATAAWNLTDSAWSLFWNGSSYGSTTQVRIGFIGGNLTAEAATFRAILKDYFNTLFATTNLLTNPTNITLSPWAASTGFIPALIHYNSGGITNLPYDNLSATTPNTGFYYQSFGVNSAVPNGTFSVYLKGTGSVRLGIFNNGTATTTTVTLTTNWRQYSVTRTDLLASYTEIAIYIDGTSNIDICYPNFEATTIANPLS
jgi:hypothetical protein